MIDRCPQGCKLPLRHHVQYLLRFVVKTARGCKIWTRAEESFYVNFYVCCMFCDALQPLSNPLFSVCRCSATTVSLH